MFLSLCIFFQIYFQGNAYSLVYNNFSDIKTVGIILLLCLNSFNHHLLSDASKKFILQYNYNTLNGNKLARRKAEYCTHNRKRTSSSSVGLHQCFSSVGGDHCDKPLSPKIFTFWFITMAELQLWNSSENSLMVGGHHSMRNCINGRSVRKIKNHWSVRKAVYWKEHRVCLPLSYVSVHFYVSLFT